MLNRGPSFDRSIDLAYFYQLQSRPGKASEAILNAITFRVEPFGGHGGNSEYRGCDAAERAYLAGEYDAAIKLCDHLLPVEGNADAFKGELRALRQAATDAKKGTSRESTYGTEVTVFDAYENIDTVKLFGRSLAKPPLKK